MFGDGQCANPSRSGGETVSRGNGINHMYLPPFSPDLNPIENVFGTLKTLFRKQGVVRDRDEMKRRICEVIDRMNLDHDIDHYYGRMRRFVGKAYNRESFN